MEHIGYLLLFLFLHILSVVSRHVSQYPTDYTKEATCERQLLIDLDNFCSLKNIRLDRQHPRFKISGSVSNITDIEIHHSSNFDVLTSIFCNLFPSLEILTIKTLQHKLQEIEEDALVTCEKLKKFTLRPNNVRTLNEKTFNRNVHLTEIAIEGNKIETIDATVFQGLINLQWLFLNGNQLLELSPEVFNGLTKLQWFDVSSNRLLDLDIQAILNYTEKLEMINLRDNYLSCERLKEMLDALEKRDIIIHKEIKMSFKRSRVYSISEDHGIECLKEDRYERELVSRQKNEDES